MARTKSHGARGAHGFLDKIENPYMRAVVWKRAPRECANPPSPKQAADWRRIAELETEMGMRLDSLGAPYYVVKWVAAPGKQRPTLRNERFDAAVAMLSRGPMTNHAWRTLQNSTPTLRGKDKLPAHKLARIAEEQELEGFEAFLALIKSNAA